MFEAGTRVIAQDVRIVVGFNGRAAIYGRGDIAGRIAAREGRRFDGWIPSASLDMLPTIRWIPTPRPPTRDLSGCYWVETDRGNRHLCRESELRRDYSPVFIRVLEREAV